MVVLLSSVPLYEFNLVLSQRISVGLRSSAEGPEYVRCGLATYNLQSQIAFCISRLLILGETG